MQTPSVKKNKLQERKGTFSVAEEVTDRTVLSDELASFCAKYPIFRLHEVPEATVTNITKTAEKPEGRSQFEPVSSLLLCSPKIVNRIPTPDFQNGYR